MKRTRKELIKIINDIVYGKIYGLEAALNPDKGPTNLLADKLISSGWVKVDDDKSDEPKEYWVCACGRVHTADFKSPHNVPYSDEKCFDKPIRTREVTESEPRMKMQGSYLEVDDIAQTVTEQPKEPSAESKILEKLKKLYTNDFHFKPLELALIEYFQAKVKEGEHD